MAIFRGIGGAGSGDNDATVTAVTTKATEAAASATAASSSASSAATSATASANSATTSSTKASEASASNDTATTKAGEASTSATAAANSATASANSATAAASSATDAAAVVPQTELAATGSPTFAAITINGNIIATGTVDGRDLQTDGTKLDAIEAGATADQTNDEIKAAVEAATDSNTFTDADHTKLDAIEAGADVTDATNVAAAGALMESELADIAAVKATTGTFLVADQTKLDGIEASANNYVHPNHSGEVTSTADGVTVIASSVVDEDNLKISNSPTNGYFLSAQSGDTGGLTWAAANNYVHPNHSGEVTSTADGATVIADNVVDEANLKVSNAPTNGYALTAQSGNTGGMTWAEPAAGAKGGGTDKVFWENDQTVDTDYTITTSQNAMTAGPITISSGITVTVPSGSTWIIL